MALSLASIHQPLNDFFLNLYRPDSGSLVIFRFDKYGSLLSDGDFIDPLHPELGYSPGLAMEKFSRLVNYLPMEAGDGVNIVFSESTIDERYFFGLLSPSLPYAPDDADDATKEALAGAFSAVKADALKVWDDVKAESFSGLMVQYKPSLATPAAWYDRSKTDAWTSQSFQITESSSPPPVAVDGGAANRLWRLRPSSELIARVLDLGTAAGPRPPVAAVAASAQPIGGLQAVAASPGPVIKAAPVGVATLHTTYLEQYQAMDLRDRMLVSQYVGDAAPRQPAETSSISVSFDYCLVKAYRPWYVDAFINQPSWWLPGEQKGQLSASDTAGGLTWMPIGFVAVRNLAIEADWTAGDLANAAMATDFGPFKVSLEVGGKLSHPGLQTVGWLLQKMPGLPPNSPPGSVPP